MSVVRSLAFFTAFVFVLVFGASLSAQTRVNNSGTGGKNIIKGQIYTSGNKRAEGQITVRLQSFGSSELTLITDQSGGFEFQSLTPGSYTLVVDAGDPWETFRESITIEPDYQPDSQGRLVVAPNPKTYQVPVYLQIKHNSAEKNGVVDARLAQAPRDAVKHYERGLDSTQAGKADEALTEFKAAVTLYPDMPPAYVEMGKIYLRTGRMNEAESAFAKALKYDPNDFDANLDHGIALYGKNDFAAAEADFNAAARLNPTAVTPHYYLGMLFMHTKNLDKAQAELETAKQLKGDKNFPTLHRHLGDVYAARSLNKQAIAELETYLKLAPGAKDADSVRQTIADLKSKIN